MNEVERLYSNWSKNHPEVKNENTRNLKHFRAYLTSNDGIKRDGYLVEDLETKIYERDEKWKIDRAKILKNQQKRSKSRASTNNTDWVSIGMAFGLKIQNVRQNQQTY